MDALERVAIRRAGVIDAPSLAAVVEAAGERGNWRGHDFGADLASASHFAYLAEDDAVFGFVLAGPSATLSGQGGGGGPTGEIVALYLRASHQGFGMGRKLLVRGLSVLKRRGFDGAFAWLPDDPHVLSVFEGVGFEAVNDLSRLINPPAGGTIPERGFHLSLEAFF